jgi:hypothetical protein
VAESYVSIEAIGKQGVGTEVEVVTETLPRISPRMPDNPALANGSVTVLNCSDPTVKDVAVPISPFALKNEIVPVQDGAGVLLPEDAAAAAAVFTTVIEAVSLLPKPMGGKT